MIFRICMFAWQDFRKTAHIAALFILQCLVLTYALAGIGSVYYSSIKTRNSLQKIRQLKITAFEFRDSAGREAPAQAFLRDELFATGQAAGYVQLENPGFEYDAYEVLAGLGKFGSWYLNQALEQSPIVYYGSKVEAEQLPEKLSIGNRNPIEVPLIRRLPPASSFMDTGSGAPALYNLDNSILILMSLEQFLSLYPPSYINLYDDQIWASLQVTDLSRQQIAALTRECNTQKSMQIFPYYLNSNWTLIYQLPRTTSQCTSRCSPAQWLSSSLLL